MSLTAPNKVPSTQRIYSSIHILSVRLPTVTPVNAFLLKSAKLTVVVYIIIVVIDELSNASLASYIIRKSPVDESYCISCLVKPHHFLPLIIPSPGHLQVVGYLFIEYIDRKS